MTGGIKLKTKEVLLEHGAGGRKTAKLIEDICFSAYGNSNLIKGLDAALLQLPEKRIAMTTDSFVVNPIIFPGGDIGKLAVCGTVNDLAVMGAKPLYLTISLILEEGFSLDELRKVMDSAGEASRAAGVEIVAGDTKVVEKGAGDGIYINTSGIGIQQYQLLPDRIKPGDHVIVSGSIANHGLAIMAARENLELNPPLQSDCTHLNHLTSLLLDSGAEIKCMRDPTRGGLGMVLNELALQSQTGVLIREEKIPIEASVRKVCSLLGLDPIYMANEGRLVIVTAAADAEPVVDLINEKLESTEAAVIGEITLSNPARVVMETSLGSLRIVPGLSGLQLPRIC
jgi:hydrogenase expression/formation protein HypE